MITANAATDALQFTVPGGTAAAQVALTFTATSGSLTQVVTAPLTITAAAAPPPPTPPPPVTVPPFPPARIADACAVPLPTMKPAYSATGFIATGNPSQPSVVFDKLHDQIFVTNFQLNAIDIVSPELMSVVARLPVPQPFGLDLSADGASLIVGTRTHYFYKVSTASLCVTGREYLNSSSFLTSNLSPMSPTTIADSSILFLALDNVDTASSVVRWVPGTGFVQPPGSGALAYSAGGIVASGDRQHAYIAGQESGNTYGWFDVSTGAVTMQVLAPGSYPNVIAANADGSRALVENDCCSLEMVDSKFQVLATLNGLFLDRVAFAESDFSRFYVKDAQQDYATILDASLQPAGIVPFSLPGDYGDVSFLGMDLMHRLIATSPLGLFLINTDTIQPLPAGAGGLPSARPGIGINGAMVPFMPHEGYTTT